MEEFTDISTEAWNFPDVHNLEELLDYNPQVTNDPEIECSKLNETFVECKAAKRGRPKAKPLTKDVIIQRRKVTTSHSLF